MGDVMREYHVDGFDSWRDIARELLKLDVPPMQVRFVDVRLPKDLFADAVSVEDADSVLATLRAESSRGKLAREPKVAKEFLEAARVVACYRDGTPFDLLYRILYRTAHGEPNLLANFTDDDTLTLTRLCKEVKRDAHKMKAFVRFRQVSVAGVESFIAWHRPDHFVVRLVAPFFSRRFPTMNWTLLTPDESAHWDQETLQYGPGCSASEAPDADQLEDLWRTYYASIFNPARIKLKQMKREMPVRHWPTLPETALIPNLLAQAPERVRQMIERQRKLAQPTSNPLPTFNSLALLNESARHCQNCDLYRCATQTVLGEGPANARIMFVGEQPGDQEDRLGRVFVGPAGQVLNQALAEAGIKRDDVYITNAVKHFKFEERGKIRLHQKPTPNEVSACRPWFEAERTLINPQIICCLGVTALQMVMGRGYTLTRSRGQFIATRYAPLTLATFHPSAVLRAPDENRRQEILTQLVADLKLVAEKHAELIDSH